MTKVERQYYEAPGAPMDAPATVAEVVLAWTQHRTRLRTWLHELPEAAWTRPTRCSGWTTTGLVEHLISGAQFLGYTLHQSRRDRHEPARGLRPAGNPCRDSSAVPRSQQIGAARRPRRGRREGRCRLTVDRRDWASPAEAPPGLVCAPAQREPLPLRLVGPRARSDASPLARRRSVRRTGGDFLPGRVVGAAAWADDAGPTRSIVLDVIATDLGICVSTVRDAVRTTTTLEVTSDADQRVAGTVDDLVDFANRPKRRSRTEGDPGPRSPSWRTSPTSCPDRRRTACRSA